MKKTYQLIGGGFALTTVLLGAFGAHGLKDILEANNKVNVWNTAVEYMAFHALALLVLSSHLSDLKKAYQQWIGMLLVVGVIVFSGSLFLLAYSNNSVLGAITPVGGLAFIVGWALYVIAVAKK